MAIAMGVRMNSPLAPPPLLEPVETVVRAADAPAREAVRLARAPLAHSLSRAAIGALMLAAAALLVAALAGAPDRALHPLLLACEALATVVPVTVLAAAWTNVAPPRLVLATVALGVLTAGWVALGLAPLAAFSALVAPSGRGARAGAAALEAYSLMIAVVGVGAVAVVLRRVFVSLDEDGRGRWVARLFTAGALAVLAVRAQPWLRSIGGGLRAW